RALAQRAGSIRAPGLRRAARGQRPARRAARQHDERRRRGRTRVTELDLTAAHRRRLRLPQALGERDFRRFWAGETISLFGDQISLIALPLVGVLVLNASAAQMGLL